jgi:hypothetical protein
MIVLRQDKYDSSEEKSVPSIDLLMQKRDCGVQKAFAAPFPLRSVQPHSRSRLKSIFQCNLD